ncbi:hypothetical protein MY8738_002858 [Beauveria namnaoensis]
MNQNPGPLCSPPFLVLLLLQPTTTTTTTLASVTLESHQTLTLALHQVAAAVEGFFWPKIFWDFATKNLDGAVKPIPVLQLLNLFFGLGMLALEWPLGAVAGTSLHRSLEFRLIFLPLTILTSVLMYQSTNPAIYYLIGMAVYFWAYSEGEVNFLFVFSSFPLSDSLRTNID